MAIVLDPSVGNPAAPTTITSSDGRLTVRLDIANAGAILVADFTGASPQPVQCRFLRNGVPVRSGDPAWAPGGYAIAYDHEAPLGVTAQWQAQPIYRTPTGSPWPSSDGLYDGTPSTAAGLIIPEPTGSLEVWVKPLNDPTLAMATPLLAPEPEFPEAAAATFTPIRGARYPAVSYTRRVPQPRTLTFEIGTVDQRDRFLACIDQGPVLIQARTILGIHDLYAMPTDLTETYLNIAVDPTRAMALQLQPIARPPTVDSALFVPGRSYDATFGTAGSYTVSQSLWPLYPNVVGV